jgi:hydrogenase maturation protease
MFLCDILLSMRMGIKIFFVGNPSAGDDAIGSILCDSLKRRKALKTMEIINIGVAGIDLVSRVNPEDQVIIIDAAHSPDPIGKVRVYAERHIPKTKSPLSAHDIGLEQSIRLLRLCHPRLGPLTIITVSISANVTGPIICPRLRKRLPAIKREVLAAILESASRGFHPKGPYPPARIPNQHPQKTASQASRRHKGISSRT